MLTMQGNKRKNKHFTAKLRNRKLSNRRSPLAPIKIVEQSWNLGLLSFSANRTVEKNRKTENSVILTGKQRKEKYKTRSVYSIKNRSNCATKIEN